MTRLEGAQQSSSRVDTISISLDAGTSWHGRFIRAAKEASPELHLGVFVEPFLQFVIDGEQDHRITILGQSVHPYDEVVHSGDVLLLNEQPDQLSPSPR